MEYGEIDNPIARNSQSNIDMSHVGSTFAPGRRNFASDGICRDFA